MTAPLLPLQFGIPGGPELLVILLIAVLLFGANKIPKLARSTGEAMGEFQKGREEVEQELQEMRDGSTRDREGTASRDETRAGTEERGGDRRADIEEAETEPQTEPQTEPETEPQTESETSDR